MVAGKEFMSVSIILETGAWLGDVTFERCGRNSQRTMAGSYVYHIDYIQPPNSFFLFTSLGP